MRYNNSNFGDTQSCQGLQQTFASLNNKLGAAISSKNYSAVGPINQQMADTARQMATTCAAQAVATNIAQANQSLAAAVISNDPVKIEAATKQMAAAAQSVARIPPPPPSAPLKVADRDFTTNTVAPVREERKSGMTPIILVGLGGLAALGAFMLFRRK